VWSTIANVLTRDTLVLLYRRRRTEAHLLAADARPAR
jgi:hypothetical protein